MASFSTFISDPGETCWHEHQHQRGVKSPGQLPLLEHTQLRDDSNTNREYCNNCQYVGNFISTRLLINRIPVGDTFRFTRDKKHEIIKLGNLGDLQANQDCVCCQSIVSALEGRAAPQRHVAIQGRLHQWNAELCWNGDMFHCILHGGKINESVALVLTLSILPSGLGDLDPCSFPYWRYSRLMDVYKIDTTLIQEWIETCDRLHGPESQNIGPLLPASKLPWLYLIDLERQCLVKIDTTQSPRYIALSYVWGGVEMLKTTTENLEKLLRPGALIESQGTKGPKLAQTILDAMDLARKLGCPFFWTDCICIVQDDEEERTMFLNAMASIYANAYLTIAAAEGADGNSGIPGLGRCSEPRDTFCSEIRFPGHTLLLRLENGTIPGVAVYGKGKTWSTRGWTFQESYLSHRLLVFTSIVSFHCQKHTSFESDFTPHGISRGRFGYADSFVNRTSFVCNVPDWPHIGHYMDVVKEYGVKNLTFDDDILDAFAGVTAVLNKSFHSGFHHGLPEVFFDASLLWEPDWMSSAPPQLRKTQKLLLPSWSWLRRKGSIQTRVCKLFAEDFYKDTSFDGIYELYPRVQWWKIGSQGRVVTPIKHQHFSNHASMPPGWNPPTFRSGMRHRYYMQYSHTLSPDTKYPHPFPFPETAEAHLPGVEHGPLLRCFANRGWLIKSNKLEEYERTKLYGTFNLCLSDGTWAGILLDDRLDQGFPQKSGEKCEVIAIAEGRVPHVKFGSRFPERDIVQQAIFSGEESSAGSYEFYFILWIGWVNGIAYRRGIGRVLKGVWEKMELEEIEVLLG